MASYFDVAPAKAAPAADTLDVGDRKAIGDMGLLSPQVTRILESMELEEASSSSSSDDDGEDDRQGEKASLSEPSTSSATNIQNSDPAVPRHSNGPSLLYKDCASPLSNKNTKHILPPGTPPPSDQPFPKSFRKLPKVSPKQPDLSRFQSLRTMLFNSHIEQNMKKQKAELAKEEAEQKWKKDFEGRKGLERQPTSDKVKEKGVMKRMGSKLRRLTSKDVHTIKRTGEEKDNASTASSDDGELKLQPQPSKPSHTKTVAEDEEDEEEDIDHSDIEDLVRWVSRKDPPSDGESRSRNRSKNHSNPLLEEPAKEDSGHESLGHSDVDELVRWVSRRSTATPPTSSSPKCQPSPRLDKSHKTPEEPSTSQTSNHHGILSSASTQPDSQGPTSASTDKTTRRKRSDTIDHSDVEDLVRWVSRKEGSNGGPIVEPSTATSKSSKQPHSSRSPQDTVATPSSSSSEEEDASELVRWVTHRDDTSGESDVEQPTPPSQTSLAEA